MTASPWLGTVSPSALQRCLPGRCGRLARTGVDLKHKMAVIAILCFPAAVFFVSRRATNSTTYDRHSDRDDRCFSYFDDSTRRLHDFRVFHGQFRRLLDALGFPTCQHPRFCRWHWTVLSNCPGAKLQLHIGRVAQKNEAASTAHARSNLLVPIIVASLFVLAATLRFRCNTSGPPHLQHRTATL